MLEYSSSGISATMYLPFVERLLALSSCCLKYSNADLAADSSANSK